MTLSIILIELVHGGEPAYSRADSLSFALEDVVTPKSHWRMSEPTEKMTSFSADLLDDDNATFDRIDPLFRMTDASFPSLSLEGRRAADRLGLDIIYSEAVDEVQHEAIFRWRFIPEEGSSELTGYLINRLAKFAAAQTMSRITIGAGRRFSALTRLTLHPNINQLEDTLTTMLSFYMVATNVQKLASP